MDSRRRALPVVFDYRDIVLSSSIGILLLKPAGPGKEGKKNRVGVLLLQKGVYSTSSGQ